MWERVLDRFLRRMIVVGELKVVFPDGTEQRYGNGQGLAARVSIHDRATLRALCVQPELGFGEAYMNATLTVDDDDIEGMIRLVLRNKGRAALPVWTQAIEGLRLRLGRFLQRNTPRSSRQNVAHHYDISDDLYRLFLDDDMQYSCGYFTDPGMRLEDAQVAKKAHIAAKLNLTPGQRVLDIGCGWGGMAITLARDYGVHVTGVTLSENQLATAKSRAEDAGVGELTDFRLQDYRTLDTTFDRIVSVGMLEHVGLPHFNGYFSSVGQLLRPDGVALIHTIGRSGPPMSQSRWINRYVFPGGYVPSLSELAKPVEQSGLWMTDLEVWRLHYAYTLRHWRDRFVANLPTIRENYDDRFVRMWTYYLTVCFLAFEEQQQSVFQMQLTHKRDAVPITRDYLYPTNTAERHAAE